VAFNIVPGIGRVKFAQLENYFGKLENAWQAGPADLKQAGLESHVIKSIQEMRPHVDTASEMERLERAGIRVYTFHDDDYPARLREIYDYPPVV